MEKSYYSILREESQPLWTQPGQSVPALFPLAVYSNIPLKCSAAKLEYFERAGEGAVYRDAYLQGGTRKS
jgi:hypothetical protein